MMWDYGRLCRIIRIEAFWRGASEYGDISVGLIDLGCGVCGARVRR